MKKSCSALVLLTHTVNIFMQLRSPGPPLNNLPRDSGAGNTPYGKLEMPFVHEQDNGVLLHVVPPRNEDEEEDTVPLASSSQAPELVDPPNRSNGAPLLETGAHQQQQNPSPRSSRTFRSSTPLGDSTCGAFLVAEEEDAEQKQVFKAASAEGRDQDSNPLKRGVVYGDSTAKEIACHVLGAQFDVPYTEAVMSAAGELGSLQTYVEHSCSAEDLGPSVFSVEEVQKIGILDARILNLDRHLTNLLVVETSDSEKKLVPIDHGYSLPSYKDMTDVYFGWTYWKQCKQAWTLKSLTRIAELDALAGARQLHQLGIHSDSILASVFSTLFLQYAAQHGITLFQVALFLQSDIMGSAEETPSQFEAILKDSLAGHQDFHFDWSATSPHPEWLEITDKFFSAVSVSFQTTTSRN